MVCNSCVRVVREDLERTGFISVQRITIGEAEIAFDSKVITLEIINSILNAGGFELIYNNNLKIVEQIKSAVIQLVFYGNNTNSLIRNSDYLSEKLGYSYQQLSKIFSELTNSTLEKYIILVKMEKIKELITYDEVTVSEIAFMMGYSSVQYLSNQFKQVTGLTVKEYKNLNSKERKPLSSLLE